MVTAGAGQPAKWEGRVQEQRRGETRRGKQAAGQRPPARNRRSDLEFEETLEAEQRLGEAVVAIVIGVLSADGEILGQFDGGTDGVLDEIGAGRAAAQIFLTD